MENASKALIIAGSILIVIILVAVGVGIVNSISGTTDQAESQAKTMEGQLFNNKFKNFEGKNKTAAEVRELINVVVNSNAANESMVAVNLLGTYYATVANVPKALNKVIANKRYDIQLVYDDGTFLHTLEPTKTGYVYRINITESTR